MNPLPSILNIAVYKFTTLTNLPSLRTDLLTLSTNLHLKGTILLAEEGINLFLAGTPQNIQTLLTHLHSLPALADLTPKESHSQSQPFLHLRVKIKKQIIPFNDPSIDPRLHTAPRISPQQLKQWLDEKRPLTLLDTRNNHEVRLGTFHHALPININDFRDFPKAVSQLPPNLKNQNHPLITFCTGGIRCEKAAPFLQSQGYQNVYQLDGGILKYLQTHGNAHYSGTCFVFDTRHSLDANLTPHPIP